MISLHRTLMLGTFAMITLANSAVNAQTETGIYVERYFPTDVNPCFPNSQITPNDGWFAVPGFGVRRAWCPGTTAGPGSAYGSNISFQAESNAIYRVYAVDNTQSIGTITVTGIATGYTLFVGRPTIADPPSSNPTVPLPTAGGGVIGAISAPNGTVQVRATNSVASVTAATIVRVDARNEIGPVTSFGAITGAIRAPRLTGNVSAATGIRDILAERWEGGVSTTNFAGSVSTSSGDIARIVVRDARFLGQAEASSGNIGVVEVSGTGSGIGAASGAPATIRARNGIRRVIAPIINATIDAAASGGTGNLEALEANSGSFTGSLRCNRVARISGSTSFIRTAGDLDADITVFDTIENEGGFNSSTIQVGGEFKAGRVIRVNNTTWGYTCLSTNNGVGGISIAAAQGLKGQVIVGPNNTAEWTCSSPPVGFWGGRAFIGPVGSTITLDPRGCSSPGPTFGCFTGYTPYYEPTSASLGGGAIGSVPFRIHESDCIPLRDAEDCVENLFVDRVWPTGTTRRTMIIRHYGPLADIAPSALTGPSSPPSSLDDVDASPPVKIWRQSLVQTCTPEFIDGIWVCTPQPLPPAADVTNEFCVRVAPMPTFASAPPGMPAARELWIAPINAANWDPLALQQYTIELRRASPSSPGELRSNTLTTNDPPVLGYPITIYVGGCPLFSYLNAGQTGPDLGEPGGDSASATTTEPYDLALVLAAWLASPADVTNDGLIDADDADALRQAVEFFNARAAARAMPVS